MNTQLQGIIDATVTIGTVPKTLAEVQRVTGDPKASTSHLAVVIRKDPVVAARVLRMANSAAYVQQENISAIDIACVVLGFRTISNLVIQATVLGRFRVTDKIGGLDVTRLWDHSFKAAMAARFLVDVLPSRFGMDADEAYTCGLLHDLGKILLLQSQPEKFRQALVTLPRFRGHAVKRVG